MGINEEANNQIVVLYKNQVTVLCKVTNHKNTPVKTPIATPYLMKGFSKNFSKLLQKSSLPVGTSEEVNNQLVVLHKNQVTVLCKVTNHKNTPVKTTIATPYLMKGVQNFYKYFCNVT